VKFYYLDTTALVKHYHLELGSQAVDDLMDHPGHVMILGEPAISDLYTLFSGRVESGEITRDDYFTAIATFESEISHNRFQFLEVDAATLKNIRLLLLNHQRLGAQQGLHLALCMELLAIKPTVVSTDPALLSACEAEGFQVMNPESIL